MESDLKSFKLFFRLNWEPFESKLKPIQDKFLDHTLVVVRSAGVRISEIEEETKWQTALKRKGKPVAISAPFFPSSTKHPFFLHTRLEKITLLIFKFEKIKKGVKC